MLSLLCQDEDGIGFTTNTFFSKLFILGSVRTVLADKKGTDTVSSKHTEHFTTGINDTGRHV